MNPTTHATGALNEPPIRVPLLRRLLRAINNHNVSALAALYAEDYEGLDVSCAHLQHGRAAVREAYEAWFQAFPDLRLSVTEMMTQPERVAVSWTGSGTHQDTFLHVPPTGQHVTVCGISILSTRQATITRGLHLWDMAGLLCAMKLLPDLPSTGHNDTQALLLSTFLRRP